MCVLVLFLHSGDELPLQSGKAPEISLDSVYIALRADRSSAFERAQAKRALLAELQVSMHDCVHTAADPLSRRLRNKQIQSNLVLVFAGIVCWQKIP